MLFTNEKWDGGSKNYIPIIGDDSDQEKHRGEPHQVGAILPDLQLVQIVYYVFRNGPSLVVSKKAFEFIKEHDNLFDDVVFTKNYRVCARMSKYEFLNTGKSVYSTYGDFIHYYF